MSEKPPASAKALFPEWRSPRRGTENPQVMTNEVWTWLVNNRVNAYQAKKMFGGPSPLDAGPGWCFERFGQTETRLPDGRTLHIAGEHEDYYDPDFYIYNDVVVVDASGEISIFGYPVEVFPPTDFHTATLQGNRVVLIGNLSYGENRIVGKTQVLLLELDTWQVSPVETQGEAPGWIHRHKARLSDTGHEIIVSHGEVHLGADSELFENIDDWSLDTKAWRWDRLTRREWPRFRMHREDMQDHRLFEMRYMGWMWDNTLIKAAKKVASLVKDLGPEPDLSQIETLYAPSIATEILDDDEDEESYGTHRIRIDDVTVRYVEKSSTVDITIEGSLPQHTLDILKKDFLEKFAALQRVPVACSDIPSM